VLIIFLVFLVVLALYYCFAEKQYVAGDLLLVFLCLSICNQLIVTIVGLQN